MEESSLRNKFQLKQFSILHDECGLRVGTDAILLGSWVASLPNFFSKKSTAILDIGTGSGIIALMMAQSFPSASVSAIEIDETSGKQANENFFSSPFAERMKLIVGDFTQQEFQQKFDLIVSNPPYFEENLTHSRQSSLDSRVTARQTVSLSYEQLIKKSSEIIADEGKFAVVLPYDEAQRFIGICAEHNLYLSHRTDIKTTTRKTPKRVLLAFQRTITPTLRNTLTLQNADGTQSKEYRELTKEFLL